jgi:hypothetical protein
MPASYRGCHRALFRVHIASVLMLALLAAMTAGCTKDPFRQRTDAIKDHVKAFYDHLQAGRVGAAVVENERIEGMAAAAGADVLRRGRPVADNQVDRDWLIVKAANEAAAENWLALARYLTIKKRFSEARAAYGRVLDGYDESAYRAYTEQARRGIKDLDVLNPIPTQSP